MKDVVKSQGYAGEYKTINGQRVKVNRKKRRNNMRGVYAIAVVFASVIILILCMTIFFNFEAKDVKINGVTLYTKEQILVVGGVSGKNNLVRIDTDLIEERLKKHLVYIDDVQVKKKYPSGIEINVQEAKKAADIEFNGKYYVLSKSGKMLECANSGRSKGIPLVKGMKLKSVNPGDKLKSEDALKTKILNNLVEQADNLKFGKITEIDLTDRTNITLNYDNRISIYIGSSVDMDYKLKFIKAVIDGHLTDNFKGTLRYNGVNSGISAIPESDKTADKKTQKNTKNNEQQTAANAQTGNTDNNDNQ